MSAILGAFGLVGFLAFLILLIVAAVRKKPKKLSIIGAVICLVMFIIGLNIPHEPEIAEQTQPAEETEMLSEEEQIRAIVSKILEGKNNNERDYLRDIQVINRPDGGWSVFVEYNASNNLTTGLIKTGMESKMSEIYMTLYHQSGLDIRQASVAAYFPLIDQYGNENDEIVYKSLLDKTEADQVNWQADEAMLKVSILPGIWEISILHQEFRQ